MEFGQLTVLVSRSRGDVMQRLYIEHFLVGALQMRCSVVTDLNSGDTLIVDGGEEFDRISTWIDSFQGIGPDWMNINMTEDIWRDEGFPQRKVCGLINTHAHFDHTGHIPYFLQHYQVDWYLHEDDYFLQSLAQQSAKRWGFDVPEPATATKSFSDGEHVILGSLKFTVHHTPGHTLGGCCLEFENAEGASHLFAGDTIFAGSVGRTDLPHSGGDFELLATSIREKLWPLPHTTIIHPGHGPLTTVGKEFETNPYVGKSAGEFGTYGFGKYA
jgi:hydroxyacylglutathione hydrolase